MSCSSHWDRSCFPTRHVFAYRTRPLDPRTPHGPEMILVTFRTVALVAALTTVTEWRSQDFTYLGGFEIIMLGAFGFALYRGLTLPLLRIVMVLGVLHLSLSQVRHADLLGMLAPIFLTRPLDEQFTTLVANRMEMSMRLGA
jgi:hypothetical protein